MWSLTSLLLRNNGSVSLVKELTTIRQNPQKDAHPIAVTNNSGPLLGKGPE
jgi:hypothetical protein